MQISERRKKILDIFFEKKSLSYQEILEKTSELDDPIEILSDIDTLVFFRFLQNVGVKKEIEPETRLELRTDTKTQIENNPSRIDSRLEELEHEFPSWYRKLAILRILDSQINPGQIEIAVSNRYPHVRWPSSLVYTSLRILEMSKYRDERYLTIEKSERYTLASGGKKLLENLPFQQFIDLKTLKDEFTNEFRTQIILDQVRNHSKSGISSGKITRYLQKEFGMRGNKRKAVRNTLENMVFAGLLIILGSSEEKKGHVYQLGPTVSSSQPILIKPFSLPGGERNNHSVQDFKEIVEQFLGEFKIPRIDSDKISSINQILSDFEQCKQDMSLRSSREWIGHIATLSDCLRNVTAKTWERRAFCCVIACFLSRLLPPEVSIRILKDYPPPSPASEDKYNYHLGIEREYYFNLTETYLELGKDEEAFRSFEDLEKVCWQTFDFLILRGRMEMRKGEFFKALETLEEAGKAAKGRGEIITLFYRGLAHYQRGDFIEAENAWSLCLNMGCTVDQRVVVSHNLANLRRLTGRLEEAKKLYEDSIVFAERFPDMVEFKVKSLIGLANVLIDQGSWENAETTLRDVICECKESGIASVAAIAETNLGELLRRKGKIMEALECHRNALALVRKEWNPQEYGTILINVGDTLRQLKRTDEAMAAYKEAFELVSSENVGLIQALEISLAELYCDLGNFDESWELAHSVLQERWLDNLRWEAEARRIHGKILLRRNEFEKAKEALMKSWRIFKNYKLNYELAEVLKLLEECFTALGEKKQAAHYRSEREDLIKKLSD